MFNSVFSIALNQLSGISYNEIKALRSLLRGRTPKKADLALEKSN